MTKVELIESVMTKAKLKKAEAEKAVETVFSDIAEALEKGDKVQIPGFGNFEVRNRKARIGRNPKTGEEIRIAESKVPAFKPLGKLKKAVNA